ncbi:MAG: hypothetical protein ACK55Z_03645 [bacterium]
MHGDAAGDEGMLGMTGWCRSGGVCAVSLLVSSQGCRFIFLHRRLLVYKISSHKFWAMLTR